MNKLIIPSRLYTNVPFIKNNSWLNHIIITNKKSFTTAPNVTNKLPHFMTINDLTSTEIHTILSTALKFKRMHQSGTLLPQSLKGKSLAIIFNKRSTRTRIAAETSMYLLGGQAIFISPNDIQLGVNESYKDTSMVLSRLVDGIFARVHDHKDLITLQKHSSIPIINALSDDHHPTQALADALTIWERVWTQDIQKQPSSSLSTLPPYLDNNWIQGKKLAWIGDGNNVCHSLMSILNKLGMNMTIATPPGYEPNSQLVKEENSNNRIIITNNPIEALQEVDFVSTDCWISMGQESESELRRKAFHNYKVTQSLLNQGNTKPQVAFLHCLPRKQDEVDDEIFYSSNSLVWNQAENRKWTIMAVLHHALGIRSWENK